MATSEKKSYSRRLQQAIEVGMVEIRDDLNTARIMAPPDPTSLTDDDWLAILRAATEIRAELRALRYEVSG